MAMNIHHGPPGSYKTSGGIQDDFIPAVKSGRYVITNVRGLDDRNHIKEIVLTYFTSKRERKQVRESIKTFDILNIDTEVEEGREKLRKFFHWAPKNTFFFIDEINTVVQKQLTAAKLAEYDYPGGLDKAKEDDRPHTMQEALEKHRHHNWDFTLTTPNITKVHPFFRSVAEVAFAHQNRAMIGLKGYWEVTHLADTSGKSKSDILLTDNKKINKHVFKLYKSTATGEVRDSLAGRNFFLRKKVLIPLLLIFCAFIYYSIRMVDLFERRKNPRASNEIVATQSRSEMPTTNPAVYYPEERNQAIPLANDTSLVPPPMQPVFNGRRIRYVGSIGRNDYFSLRTEKDEITLNTSELKMLGYSIVQLSSCLYEIISETHHELITCQPVLAPDFGDSRRNEVTLFGGKKDVDI